MAWNPTPEVAVARDAANKLESILEVPVAMTVVFHVTPNGIGYASYGKNMALCAEARKFADSLMVAGKKYFE